MQVLKRENLHESLCSPNLHVSPAVHKKGWPWMDRHGESKQCMEQEETLGVTITDVRETKTEKKVEQKSFPKGTGEGVLQTGSHSWVYSLQVRRTKGFSSPPLQAITNP